MYIQISEIIHTIHIYNLFPNNVPIYKQPDNNANPTAYTNHIAHAESIIIVTFIKKKNYKHS